MMFDLRKIFERAAELQRQSVAAAADYLSASYSYVSESIGGLWVFGSNECLASTEEQAFDEKHYFVVPMRSSATDYSLYSMRCLPEGVGPVNDLPKRRVLHVPSEAAVEVLEELLANQARTEASEVAKSDGSMGDRLNNLADQIDRLDHQVFSGILAIGGLVALINPVAGAAIAAKALAPSAAMLLSKFGLRAVGDKLEERSVAKQVRDAEKQVLRQFRATPAVQLVNPVLEALDRALETDETVFDPLLEIDFHELQFGRPDRQRMLHLTFLAVSNVYEETLADPNSWSQRQLGDEDVRWLQMIAKVASEHRQ